MLLGQEICDPSSDLRAIARHRYVKHSCIRYIAYDNCRGERVSGEVHDCLRRKYTERRFEFQSAHDLIRHGLWAQYRIKLWILIEIESFYRLL